jgi:hypothetical protein
MIEVRGPCQSGNVQKYIQPVFGLESDDGTGL